MGLRDFVKQTTNWAVDQTPGALKQPAQWAADKTNQAVGFGLDPLHGSRTKKEEAAAAEEAYFKSQSDKIKQGIENMPEYQISDEAKQRMELLQQTGSEMVSGAEEQTDVARMRAGMFEAPGTGQSRRDIEGATARQVQAIQQMGGSGALGAAAQVGLGEERAYEDLIQSNMQYKDQSQSALMGALQTEAGLRTQAAGMEGQALEGMISEKDKVWQSKMNKAQTGLQYNISELAMERQASIAENSNKKFMGLF